MILIFSLRTAEPSIPTGAPKLTEPPMVSEESASLELEPLASIPQHTGLKKEPGMAIEESMSAEKTMAAAPRPFLGPSRRGERVEPHKRISRGHQILPHEMRNEPEPNNEFLYSIETTTAMRKLQFVAASEETDSAHLSSEETARSSAASSDLPAIDASHTPSAESGPDLETDSARLSSEAETALSSAASSDSQAIDSAYLSSEESSLLSSAVLSCSGRYMHVRVSKYELQALGYNPWDLHLNHNSCRCKTTSSYVCCKIPLHGCGTVKQQKSHGSIVYSNAIKTSVSDYTFMEKKHFNQGVIILFHVTCEMNESKLPRQRFAAKNYVTTKQHSKYNINVSIYDSSSFQTPTYNQDFINQNQDAFLQASLHSSDPTLVLFMDTCVASPDISDFETLTYDLIRSGCIQDSTYQEMPSPSNNAVRWKFNTFKFLKKHEEVYLKCHIVVCKASDYTSRCYRGCLPRKIRRVNVLHDDVGVVVGPIPLQKADKKHERKKRAILTEAEAISPLTVTAISLVAVVFVLAGFLLSSKLMRKKDHQIH